MSTESLKYARFDHPEHGSFDDVEAVMGDSRLSAEQKHEILAEWRRRVEADAGTKPGEARMGEALDRMAQSLASMRF